MTMGASSFVWYELMTSDPAGAEAFYRSVVGWSAQKVPQPGFDYRMMSAATGPAAGIMDLPATLKAAGSPSAWLGYVGVADVDAAAQHVSRAGGTVHKAPDDIPGVGRFAVVADPQGAVFALFSPADPDDQATAAGPGPGQGGWNELYATDWRKAFEFYATCFGWTKADAIDMGPMGVYQLFAAGGNAIGGMMDKPGEMPAPAWQFYFNVPAIDAAVTRVNAAGGKVLMGPMDVPGGSWIIQCIDPQGAHFALVAPVR
jgi:uncharacterized protein